jgi:hypothetical protein
LHYCVTHWSCYVDHWARLISKAAQGNPVKFYSFSRFISLTVENMMVPRRRLASEWQRHLMERLPEKSARQPNELRLWGCQGESESVVGRCASAPGGNLPGMSREGFHTQLTASGMEISPWPAERTRGKSALPLRLLAPDSLESFLGLFQRCCLERGSQFPGG